MERPTIPRQAVTRRLFVVSVIPLLLALFLIH